MRRRVGVGTKETRVLGMGSDRSFNFFFASLESFRRELLEHCLL